MGRDDGEARRVCRLRNGRTNGRTDRPTDQPTKSSFATTAATERRGGFVKWFGREEERSSSSLDGLRAGRPADRATDQLRRTRWGPGGEAAAALQLSIQSAIQAARSDGGGSGRGSPLGARGQEKEDDVDEEASWLADWLAVKGSRAS